MIYTLRRGVNGQKVPVRYETNQGWRRFLPAALVAKPRPRTMRRYAAYSAIPLLSLATLLLLALNNHPSLRIIPASPTHPKGASTLPASASSNDLSQPGGNSAAPGGSSNNLQSAGSGIVGGSSPLAFGAGNVTSPAPAPSPSPAPVGGRGSVGGGITTSIIGVGATCESTNCTVTGCTQPLVIAQGQKVILGATGTCVLVN
jgi:hypothetical protein